MPICSKSWPMSAYVRSKLTEDLGINWSATEGAAGKGSISEMSMLRKVGALKWPQRVHVHLSLFSDIEPGST